MNIAKAWITRALAATATAWMATSAIGTALAAETLTIATVNNGDMIIMQKLSPEWEKATGNKLNWVVLEENVLRQRVTTDIATKAGQFDVLTIGGYETPIWGKQGWLMPLDDLGDDYDYDDMLEPVRERPVASTASSTPCRSTPKARSRSTARICSTPPA